jgi:hypothetical protein
MSRLNVSSMPYDNTSVGGRRDTPSDLRVVSFPEVVSEKAGQCIVSLSGLFIISQYNTSKCSLI